MDTHSSLTQIYKCNKCDKKASTRPVLKRHTTISKRKKFQHLKRKDAKTMITHLSL